MRHLKKNSGGLNTQRQFQSKYGKKVKNSKSTRPSHKKTRTWNGWDGNDKTKLASLRSVSPDTSLAKTSQTTYRHLQSHDPQRMEYEDLVRFNPGLRELPFSELMTISAAALQMFFLMNRDEVPAGVVEIVWNIWNSKRSNERKRNLSSLSYTLPKAVGFAKRFSSPEFESITTAITDKNLKWKKMNTNNPWMIYPIESIKGQNVSQDKTLLNISIHELEKKNTQQTLSFYQDIGNQIDTCCDTPRGAVIDGLDTEVRNQIHELCNIPDTRYAHVRDMLQKKLERKLTISETQLVMVLLEQKKSSHSKKAYLEFIFKREVVERFPLNDIIQLTRDEHISRRLWFAVKSNNVILSQPNAPNFEEPISDIIFEITFFNQDDANDVEYIINHMNSNDFDGFVNPMTIIHEGEIRKQSRKKWKRINYDRFIRLVSGRLLIFKTENSPFPNNVINLKNQKSIKGSALLVSDLVDKKDEEEDNSITIICNKEHFIFKCDSMEDQQQWNDALRIDQSFPIDISVIFGEIADPFENLSCDTIESPISIIKLILPIEARYSSSSKRYIDVSESLASTPPRVSIADMEENPLNALDDKDLSNLVVEFNDQESLYFGSVKRMRNDSIIKVDDHAPDEEELVQMQNQKFFFHYVKNRLHNYDVFSETHLMTMVAWKELTKRHTMSKRFMNSTFASGTSFIHIDNALHTYWNFISSYMNHFKTCRISVTDKSNSTAASQIGFSWSGFDSQVFDVSKRAVVNCNQLFDGSMMSFKETDWCAALSSSSVGKELMQSSPDMSMLYVSGPQGKETAKRVMFDAQKEVLLNLCLCSYIANAKIKDGEVISMEHIKNHLHSKLNQKQIDIWTSQRFVYVYNPYAKAENSHEIRKSLMESATRERKNTNSSPKLKKPSNRSFSSHEENDEELPEVLGRQRGRSLRSLSPKALYKKRLKDFPIEEKKKNKYNRDNQKELIESKNIV